jgi:hypothetical protein
MAADALAWLPKRRELSQRYCEEAVAAYEDSTAPDWSFTFKAGSHAALAIARIGMGELEGAAEAMAWVFGLAVPQRTQSSDPVRPAGACGIGPQPLAGGNPELAEKMKVFVGARLSGNVALARLGVAPATSMRARTTAHQLAGAAL